MSRRVLVVDGLVTGVTLFHNRNTPGPRYQKGFINFNDPQGSETWRFLQG